MSVAAARRAHPPCVALIGWFGAPRPNPPALAEMLQVSEYTDKVDVAYSSYFFSYSEYGKEDGVKKHMERFFQYFLGLLVSRDIKRGSRALGRDLASNREILCRALEVGRRYKIMNPSKMRSTYGKLMLMLQDSVKFRGVCAFSCVRPVRTVKILLEERGGMAMLDDPLLQVAVRQHVGLDAAAVRAEATARSAAVEELCTKYTTDDLTQQVWICHSAPRRVARRAHMP